MPTLVEIKSYTKTYGILIVVIMQNHRDLKFRISALILEPNKL